MTGERAIPAYSGDDVAEMVTMYRRLAAMDPPALRALAVELDRLSDESSASAGLHPSPASQAQARRGVQRAAAARAALSAIASEG